MMAAVYDVTLSCTLDGDYDETAFSVAAKSAEQAIEKAKKYLPKYYAGSKVDEIELEAVKKNTDVDIA